MAFPRPSGPSLFYMGARKTSKGGAPHPFWDLRRLWSGYLCRLSDVVLRGILLPLTTRLMFEETSSEQTESTSRCISSRASHGQLAQMGTTTDLHSKRRILHRHDRIRNVPGL